MSGNTVKPDAPIALASYPRAIAHLDCDAFFASCEQARDPHLKGRPVVTGKERGIISCASYEAKALGIKRGVGLWEAKRICPDLIVLPSDYETYSLYSRRAFDIIRSFTPDVEESSIDEAFFDLTGLRRLYRSSYESIAQSIKERVHRELDITVSIGLSLTKSLAKICSRHKKPDGFTALPGHRIHEMLKAKDLEAVCGFGPNTVALLKKHGVNTVLDYVTRPALFAERLLGKVGVELWRELRGEAVYAISTKPKETYLSISKSKTFAPPSSDKEFVRSQLMRNLESAFIKLRRHNLSAKGLIVHLRTRDFRNCGLRAELDRHSPSTLEFVELCGKLFEATFRKGETYRATGVVLTGLIAAGIDDKTLFDDPVKVKKVSALTETIDRVNGRYGKYTIHLASSDGAIAKSAGEKDGTKGPHPRSDAPWRKRNLLKGETYRKRLAIPALKIF